MGTATVTVRALPLPLTLWMAAPLRLPARSSAKSATSTPITPSLNVTVKSAVAPVGGFAAPGARVMLVTVGGVESASQSK